MSASVRSVSKTASPHRVSEGNRAAVVKRGGERAKRDMFAKQPVDLGSVKVKQTLLPALTDRKPGVGTPGGGAAGGVGARNETSLLFTVDAIKGAARVKTPEPEATTLVRKPSGSRDDEGLIDLHALAATGAPSKPAGARTVAPLFSEPAAAFAADLGQASGSSAVRASDDSSPAHSKRFTTRGRAFAGVALSLVFGVIAVLFGSSRTSPSAARQEISHFDSDSVPISLVTTSAVMKSNHADSGSSAGTAETEPQASSKAKKHGKTKASFSGAKVSKTKSAATQAAPDKCGCKGDFNCQMRCAAKG